MLNFNPNLKNLFSQFSNEAYQSEALDNKNKAVVLFSVALSMEDSGLVKEGLIKAKQEGLSNEEIAQIEAIVIALKGRSVLQLFTDDKSESTQKANVSSCCS